MPELPEVEAARRAVHDHCVGKKIKSAVVADDPKVIEGVTVSDFEAALVGKTIVAALRKGKSMWLQLDSPPFPSFQFGMAGSVYIKGVSVTKYKRSALKESEEWPSKYSKVFIELENGLELSFTDKRRFARVRLLKNPATVPPISELGPDAFLEPMTVKEFTEALRKKKTVIKALLLDQSFMAGIGNWIADEVLYQARIHPQEIAANLSKESCATLHKCIKEVIECAVRVDADSSLFPPEWLFHFRWGKKAGKVNGKKIDFITAGGRTTAYVPELQKNSLGDGKAGGKPKKQIPKRKKGSSSDEDGAESGEEESGECVKPKKMQKLGGGGGGGGRKSSVQDISKESEEGSENGGGKRKAIKKMAEKKQAPAPKTTAKKGNQVANENTKRNSRVKK